MSLAPKNNVVVATEVINKERLSLMPRRFPGCFIVVEQTIYQVMDRICPAYAGGYWHFYSLSNGGFYMALEGESELDVVVPFGNGFADKLSREAASIVACLMAYCFLAEKYPSGLFADHYTWLMEYVYTHPEASKIRLAID
jgi:hypothetical protein